MARAPAAKKTGAAAGETTRSAIAARAATSTPAARRTRVEPGAATATATPRRTQTERREGTIFKLLDAAAATVVDVGYAGATVQAICSRAGVSQGALFRHFASREALMMAVCEHLGATVLADFRREFGAPSSREPRAARALRVLRERCRSRNNLALYELALAARTNPELRRALEPVTRAYHGDIERLAGELLPEIAAALGPRFRVLVDTMISVFDGEAMHRFVFEDPELDGARIELLASLLGMLTEGKPSPDGARSKTGPGVTGALAATAAGSHARGSG